MIGGHTASAPVRDELRLEDLPRPEKPLLHIFWTPGRRARLGDVAFCGHVKQTTAIFSEPGLDRPGYPYCVVCEALRGGR